MDAYRLANLSEPPESVAIGHGDMPSDRLEWIQPLDRWSVIFYQHSNVAGVDARIYSVGPGDAVFFPPGSRGSHVHTGEGTPYWVLIVRLTTTAGNLSALPLLYRDAGRFLADLERAADRLFIDSRALTAFAWNFLWVVGRDRAVARVHEELYAAEEFIIRNLGRAMSVADIAEEAGKSPRHLLRTFRREHNTTIQEFIRRKRVQEATRLLSTTNIPVKEVALRVGIPDLHAFNKLLREVTGLSPRAFRARAIEFRQS